MGSNTYSGTPLNLLVIVLIFGLELLLPWAELWWKPTAVKTAVKGPWLPKPKTRADCPLCHGE